ncbi:CAAX amino terminal protease family [Coleofasciculus chthonoplastes PCC 7420]|uniref:CAAX amino terminal protease family n=1 Tax=Coleofasciculus chthonoplastes PCC 7420 TaxID=118168 RepID=B4VX27_9CYAN|nr:type II CAAX endopeptidase family protein [Coleofasciculus chthonoplastes]EDX73565.1 CAAX amino terminal protease family [Coleofasciculus chthonoplastes PCC 7420]
MRKHPLTWFYILAFGMSWIGMVSVVLTSRDIAPLYRTYFLVLSIFYAIGPALAAVIVAQVAYGKTGVKELDKGLIKWRVGLVWYIVVLLGPVVLLITAQVVTKLLRLPVTIAVPQSNLSFFAFVINFLATTCEEIGWRGFALPRLQKQYNALTATLIVGMLWGLWHLPLIFLVGQPMSEFPFLWFIIIVTNAFIYTWIYNSTKGSILLVALFHGALNIAPNIFSAFIPGVSPIVDALVNCVVVIILIAVFGKTNLSHRKRVYVD